MASVLVLVEHAEGKVKKVTLELLTAARALGEPVAVVVGAPGSAASLVDTYLVESTGWKNVTPPTEWPIRRAKSQGRSFDLADVLVRGN